MLPSLDLCLAQPFVLLAAHTSCAESPPCSHIHCFTDIRCLLASSLSPVIAGCRSSPDHSTLFCICPSPSAPSFFSLLPHPSSIRHRPIDYKALIFNRLSSLPRMSSNSSSLLSGGPLIADIATTAAATSKRHITGGQIAGIVCGVVALVLLIGLAAFLTLRYLRDRRRNHGEYRPQFEEQHHAKDLPYLQPPAVEGLI